MDDLVRFSTVGLKEFQRQVTLQREDIDGIQARTTLLARTMAHRASAYDHDTLHNVQVLAGCPKVSEDIFLDYMFDKINYAHARAEAERAAAGEAADVADTGGATRNAEHCVGPVILSSLLDERIMPFKTGTMINFASSDLGGVVVFSGQLTSPSYAPRASRSVGSRTNAMNDGDMDKGGGIGGESAVGGHIGESMRHVLQLRSTFPPPKFAIAPKPALSSMTPALTRSGRGSNGGSTDEEWGAAGDQAKGGINLMPCWAFGGSAGRLTVRLSRPVAVTHVSLEHRPGGPGAGLSRASGGARRGRVPGEEASAAPRHFRVWGLKSTTSAHPAAFLGDFEYRATDGDLPALQVFAISDGPEGTTNPVSAYVTLDIASNHGHNE